MSSPSSPLPGPGPLVGRREELDTFRSALERVGRGKPTVIHVTGEIGIGRTRLLDEFASLASTVGTACLLTRPGPRDDEPLGGLRHADSTQPLIAFARALATPPDETERFSSLLEALAVDAGSAPVWLLIDDVHAADEATRMLVRHLVAAVRHGSLKSARVGLVLSMLEDQPPPQQPDRVAPSSESGILRLGRLAPADVQLWLEARFGSLAEHRLVQRLTEASGGNPLLLTELLVFLHRTGHLQHAEGRLRFARGADDLTLPRDLSSLLAGKIGAISSPCRRAMTLAAFLGHEFDAGILADLLGEDAAGVNPLIDEAAVASLVERRNRRLVSFKHSTARELFYDTTDTRSREQTHLQICEGLIGELGEHADEHCLAITHHLLRAGSQADGALLLRYAPLAAGIAFSHHSYFLAGRYFEAAARAGTDVLPVLRRAELYTRAGESFQRWSDGARSDACFHQALDLYREADDRIGYARALQGLLRNHVAFGEAGAEAGDLTAQLQGLIGVLPEHDAELKVRVHDTLASYYHHIARYDVAEAYAQTAMTVAQNSADPTLRCIPVTSLALAQMEQLRLTDARTTWLEGLSYDRAAGARRYEGLHLQRLPVPLYCLGEAQEAARYNQASYQHNEAIGNTGELCLNITVDVMIANLRGDFDRAIATGREAMELMSTTRYRWSAPALIGALAYALVMRQRYPEAERVIAHLTVNGLTFEDAGPYRSTARRLSELLAAHQSRGAAGAISADAGDRRRSLRGVRLGSLGRLCSETELALLQGRRARLTGVHDALEFVHRRGACLPLGWCGSIPRSLAVSTALRNGLARAAGYFAEASKLAERIHAPLEQGRVELQRGLVTLACSDGDPADARRDLSRALACFERHDAPALAGLAAAALARDTTDPHTI